MSKLDELETRAEKCRVTLYEKYKSLNELWEKAEEQLTKYHLPRAVGHEYFTECDEQYRDAPVAGHCIGVQKIKNEWRLCHGVYSYNSPDQEANWKPIVECSATLRTQLVKHLPALREAIVTSAEQFVPVVDNAISALERFLYLGSVSELLAERHKLNGKK